MDSDKKFNTVFLGGGVLWGLATFICILAAPDTQTGIGAIVGALVVGFLGCVTVYYYGVVFCAFRPIAIIAGVAFAVLVGVAVYNHDNIPKTFKWKERTGAICTDGWVSSSTWSGACSHHGGVREWLLRDCERQLSQSEIGHWKESHIHWPGFWGITLGYLAGIGCYARKSFNLEEPFTRERKSYRKWRK